MRVIIAECSAIYSGRGDTTLARGQRAILIKDDGSVSIHNDLGNKPLNYMKTPVLVTGENELGEAVWTFDARHESLAITLHHVAMETSMPLVGEGDPGLVRDGTEGHLQEWLAANPEILGGGFTLVSREYPTGNGPVDLLVLDGDGTPVAVEVKRVAMLGAVDQARRYMDALRAQEPDDTLPYDLSKTRAMVAAVDIRPRTLALAEKRGIATVAVPTDWRSSSSLDGEAGDMDTGEATDQDGGKPGGTAAP